MKTAKIPAAIKIHGGKFYLSAKIVALMPKHIHFVEPYAGGLSVLLAKNPEGVSEVVNDISLDLTIFWRVLASESHFKDFLRIVQATPFSEGAWNEAAKPYELKPNDKSVPAHITAAKFFIRCRQSLAGRMKDFATLSRRRVRRGMNEQASAWLTAVEGLPAAHERLKRVVVLNREALDVIRQQDGPETLFYIDAPYVHASRSTTGEYEHEMTDDQHRALIEVLLSIQGKAMVSMYHHEIYDALHCKHGWRLVEFSLPNNAAGGASKKRMTECLWLNYEA